MARNEEERLQEDDPTNRVNRIPDVQQRVRSSKNQQIEMREPVLRIAPFEWVRFEPLLNLAEGVGVVLSQPDSLCRFSPVA
jgi:hypothetical protein